MARLQHAIKHNDFLLYSQEIVSISKKDALPHHELLIRLRDKEGQIIYPGAFLPAAEHYNLASSLDLWVVEHVIHCLNESHQQGRDIAGIYGINLSGQSLGDKRFYESIIGKIKQNDLSHAGVHICFEITETAAISNMDTALYFINELRSLGCQFALDDFGSGLSSYAYLQQLPIDYLKIDGLFVKDCVRDKVKLEMIRSINSVGHMMQLKTIAEFVESEEIFTLLGELSIDYAQGYWSGRPQPWQFSSQ